MKNKISIISRKEFEKYYNIAQAFTKSLCSADNVIKEYNSLTFEQKKQIATKIKQCDIIRDRKIPKNDLPDIWETDVMVDFHIIATEMNLDPITCVLCQVIPPKYYRIVIK